MTQLQQACHARVAATRAHLYSYTLTLPSAPGAAVAGRTIRAAGSPQYSKRLAEQAAAASALRSAELLNAVRDVEGLNGGMLALLLHRFLPVAAA